MFTQRDADIIRSKLKHLRHSEQNQQKMLRRELRKMGFYISDFTRFRRGFTAWDFEELVQSAAIIIEA